MQEEAREQQPTAPPSTSDDSPEDQLTEAWNNCPVTERDALDLAYTREPEPIVDDEDL